MKETALLDKKLVEGCIQGDRRIQEMLYRQFAPDMFRICLAYENDRDAAKEILQIAFLKVFRNMEKFKFDGPLKAWIRRIITNTAIDSYRNEKSVEMVDLNEEVHEAEETELNIDENYYERILKEVANLPSGARMVFNLYALEGFTHKEIAGELSISIGTSKSQLNRAKQLLKEALGSIFTD